MRILSQETSGELLSNSWFLVPKPNPKASIRLFCLPYAGALAEMYYLWVDQFPSNIEVVAIQYPGHHMESSVKELYTCLSLMTKDLAEEISPFLNKKYAFFGHSIGSLLAYELTIQLRSIGVNMPDYLFLSGAKPPHIKSIYPIMHSMTDNEFAQVMYLFNLISEEVFNNQALLQKIIPPLKADFEMLETYRHNPDNAVLDVPICIFAAANDNISSPRVMEGWQKYTRQDLKEVLFPGKHFYLLKKSNRNVIIKKIIQLVGDNSLFYKY